MFSKTDDAMIIVQHLQKVRPIREGAEFYNLYKGAGGPITYPQLSEFTIAGLNLNDNETIFFAVEAEPKF